MVCVICFCSSLNFFSVNMPSIRNYTEIESLLTVYDDRHSLIYSFTRSSLRCIDFIYYDFTSMLCISPRELMVFGWGSLQEPL